MWWFRSQWCVILSYRFALTEYHYVGNTKARNNKCPVNIAAAKSKENIVPAAGVTAGAETSDQRTRHDTTSAPGPAQARLPASTDIIQSLIATPTYRQNSRVMDIASVTAMLLARREEAERQRELESAQKARE